MESLSDIVAIMRRGTKLPGYWRSCDLNKILAYHADHIEAAWKREKAEIEADALAVGGIVEAARHKPGNAAATGEKPEVADAVIAEMRDEAARADTEQYYTLDDAAESMREYANRLEAALKRERAAFDCECAGIAELAAKEESARHTPGNAAAMREALELALDALISWLNGTIDRTTNRETIKAIRAALSAPPRQCDVGTVEEQEQRYKAIGEVYHTLTLKNALAWAQKPCAEEGAGE